MLLTRISEAVKASGLTPEEMAALSKGAFSNNTVRRAMKGRGTDLLKARAIAKVLKCKVDDLI